MTRLARSNGLRLCLVLIAGVLLFSMACREVSELVQLADDTTNDFTIRAGRHHEVATPAQHPPVRIPPATVQFSLNHFEAPLYVATLFSVPAPELLHRLCILRT